MTSPRQLSSKRKRRTRPKELRTPRSRLGISPPSPFLGGREDNLDTNKGYIVVDYIGSKLSVNGCWIRGRGGVRVNAYKPEVISWMRILAGEANNLVRKLSSFGITLEPPVFVALSGRFRDLRHPDLDNLFKVVCDGLKTGLGIDDKHFRVSAGEIVIDWSRDPVLLIEISQEQITVFNSLDSYPDETGDVNTTRTGGTII